MNKAELTPEKIAYAKSMLADDIAINELKGKEMSEEEKMLAFAWYAGQIDSNEYSMRLTKLLYGTDIVINKEKSDE